MNRSLGHSMFLRVWLRSVAVKRPQSVLAFAALALGATVASLLLNLYGDARRKMQGEFRTYGPNVILSSARPDSSAGDLSPAGVMDTGAFHQIESLRLPAQSEAQQAIAVPILYSEVLARSAKDPSGSTTLVAAGSDFARLRSLNPAWKVNGPQDQGCFLGARAAERLRVGAGEMLQLATAASGASTGETPGTAASCAVAGVVSGGGPEEDQVFPPLDLLQGISGLAGRISLVEMRVPGNSSEVEAAARNLAEAFPSLDVRPVREIVQSEGRVLNTIRGLTLALAGLIIGVVVLCVMATVTTIVLERRKEVAVMKALGASDRTLLSLLLAEVGILGVLGGFVGFMAGALLARRLGLDLFGAALDVDWHTLLPVVATALVVAAVPAMLPVSTVRSIDPARALRGE